MDEPDHVSTRSMLRYSEALLDLGLVDDPSEDPTHNPSTLPADQQSKLPISETFAKPGKKIGRYVLKSELGEGGFGSVWLADQCEPIRREVALKLIKPGMSSRQLITRFESERQALAMMNHSNIAAVLDAGTTEMDLPYFVMELVKGSPITQYCNQTQLPLRDRLRLFLPVCQAVHHAHQKAILHRDLKPSNILIDEQNQHIEPKIIDFGIAKVLGSAFQDQNHDNPTFTQQGFVIGTPQYMSPEQAGGSHGVDTRSDIYALGAILYELVTAQAPLADKLPDNLAYDQMLTVIREITPTRPSALWQQQAELDQSLHAASTLQSTPHRLSQELRGEIDWIILKALDKEPSRRYESAAAMAADIEKHLDNQPISARPPSVSYNLRKFVRRNRIAVTYSLVAFACLLLGLSAAGWSYLRQRAALRQSLISEQTAKTEAEKNVRASLFLGGIFKDISLRNRHSLTPHALRELLEAVNERRASELSQQPEIDAMVTMILADAFREINQLNKAVTLYSHALTCLNQSQKNSELELAQCYYWLAWIQRHQNDVSGISTNVNQSLSHIQSCLQLLNNVSPPPAELTLLAKIQHAALLRQTGNTEEATRSLTEISSGPWLAVLRRSSASGWLSREQALLKMKKRAYDEAETLLVQAGNLLTSSATSESMKLQVRADILALRATVHSRAGRHENALHLLEDELDVRHVWLLQTDATLMVRMADSLMALHRELDAEVKLQQALQIASDGGEADSLEIILRKLLQIQRKRGNPNPPYTWQLTSKLAQVLSNQLDVSHSNPEAWEDKHQQLNELFTWLALEPMPPELVPLLLIRSSVHARGKNFTQAINDLKIAQKYRAFDHSLAFRIAAYNAANQRDSDIPPLITQILSAVDRTADASEVMPIFWACRIFLLSPTARSQHHILQPYFDHAIKNPTFTNMPEWTSLFLGVMEHARGAHSAAHEWLEGITHSDQPVISAYAMIFSSMNYLKMGKHHQAKIVLQDAQTYYQKNFAPFLSQDTSPSLHDTLSIQTLLKEAQSTLHQQLLTDRIAP